MRVAVLIPEWPGQTHIWMWREFVELRRQGLDLRFFSTRRPPERDAARHGFAAEAVASTVYLWPPAPGGVLGALLVGLRHPLRMIWGLLLALRTRDRHGRRSGRNCALLASAMMLAHQVRRQGCEHVYVQSAADSALVARFVRMLVRTPYSVVVNASVGWWGGGMSGKLGPAAAVVTHAAWIQREIQTQVPGIDPSKVILAPVGVDLDLFTPGNPRPRCEPPVRLVSVGRLHPSKGHATVIRVVARAKEIGLALRLRVLGGGPQELELRELTARLGLEGSVFLCGSVSEERVRGELRDADIFVLPTSFESLGVVYMEAMACGVPVVGTRNGGACEIIDHGKNGFLVDPTSIDEILGAIRALAGDDALRMEFSRLGRRRVEERFDYRLGAARVAAMIRATSADAGVGAGRA